MDVDFEFKPITIHNAKGAKDSLTPLPDKIIESLKEHLEFVTKSYEKGL